jgi:hypothetical protein
MTFSINYTSLASGKIFKTFSQIGAADYSKNKVMIFTSCLEISYVPGPNIIQFEIDSVATNSSYFSAFFTFGTEATLTRLHATLIIFDEGELNVNGFYPFYVHVNFTDLLGGEIMLPYEYASQCLMGWTDHKASSLNMYMSFSLLLTNLSVASNYGVVEYPPTPVNFPTNLPIEVLGVSLFYMKQLFCTDPRYYMDISNQLCIECPLGCATCSGPTHCFTCQSGYSMNVASFVIAILNHQLIQILMLHMLIIKTFIQVLTFKDKDVMGLLLL